MMSRKKQALQPKTRVFFLILACFPLIIGCGRQKKVSDTPPNYQNRALSSIDGLGSENLIVVQGYFSSEDLTVREGETKEAYSTRIQHRWTGDKQLCDRHSEFKDWPTNNKIKDELEKIDVQKVIYMVQVEYDLDLWKEWLENHMPEKKKYFFKSRSTKSKKEYLNLHSQFQEKFNTLSSNLDCLKSLQKKEQLDQNERNTLLTCKYTVLQQVSALIDTSYEFECFKRKYAQ